MNRTKKSRKKKKKTTRREFLTTAGALAAGTMVAGNALAQELKRRVLLAPKVVKKAEPSFTLEARVKRYNDKLNYKVTTPSGQQLSIKQIQSNKPLVENDIKRIANEIANQINDGKFALTDLYAGLDMMQISIDPSNEARGSFCYGDSKDNIGSYCGNDCAAAAGDSCGCSCQGIEGENCGYECWDRAEGMLSSENAFIASFIDDVQRDLNILNPAVNTIIQSYSHDIMAQVMSRMLDPTRLQIK